MKRFTLPPGIAVGDDGSDSVNVLVLVKKATERYVFLFDNEHQHEAMRTLGRFASNPDLSFTWYDAAILSQKIKGMTP